MRLAYGWDSNVFLKMECEQPTGSFKIRGIGLLCQTLNDEGCDHFVCSSGGNAGVAVAYMGQKLGINTTVFVPKTTSSLFLENLKAKNADVIITGNNWNEADLAANDFLRKQGGAYIPPYDHPLIWQGHASMVHEVNVQIEKPDAIMVAVGGGGLLMGVLQGLTSVGWQDMPVFSVETEGAACFAKSIKANKKITLSHIDTIATSLGAKSVCDALWQAEPQFNLNPLVVTDQEAVKACQFFYDHHQKLVEPACGAVLAALAQAELKSFRSILVVVCGGIGWTQVQMARYQC